MSRIKLAASAEVYMAARSSTPKQEALRLLKRLKKNASWNEIVYAFDVRASIERGLADVKAGRVTNIESIRAEFGLDV
jgi:hypothetical protein